MKNSKKFKSQLVQNFDNNYSKQKKFNDRLRFIINVFNEYRNDHSFGEYDYSVVVDEEVETERYEHSEFLVQKFSEIQDEIKST